MMAHLLFGNEKMRTLVHSIEDTGHDYIGRTPAEGRTDYKAGSP